NKGTRQPLALFRIVAIVDPRFIFLEVDDQFNRSVRHQALFRMRAPREAVVIPEDFYKLIERLPRDVSEVQHDRKSVLLLRASPCRSTQHNSKTMPRECGAKSKNLLSG